MKPFVDYSLTAQQRLDNIKALDLPTSPDGYYLDVEGKKVSFMGNRDLKSAYTILPLTTRHVEEIYKCMISVEYFFFNYCQIVTNKGFTFGDTREYQINLLNFLAAEKRCALSLPRQSSKSVTTGVHILHKILFNKDANWGLAANLSSMSKEVLSKIKQTYLRLPIWLQQGIVSWNATSISLENGARVLTSATTGNSFRGFTFATPGSGVFVDETAFVSGPLWEEFYDSVMPTVSSSKDSQIVLASTPNGMNHWYYIVKDAEENKTEFKPFRIEWYEVPGRDEEWLNKQIETFGKLYVNQNFLCQFAGSSETLVDTVALQRLRPELPAMQDKFMKGINIYDDVQEKHNYIMSVDTAKDGDDKFSFHIIDITKFPFKQVLTANLEVSYLKMPKVLLDIATYYNQAFVIIENVEGSGQSIADTLYNVYEYEHLYRDKHKDYPGFRTNRKTRSIILNFMKIFIENDKLIIYDKTTINQLNTFIKRKGKYQADSGAKDDLVMSLAMAFVPFMDISAYSDYTKFMDALEEIGIINDEDNETGVNLSSLVSIGYFDDGVEDDLQIGLREGMYNYDTYDYDRNYNPNNFQDDF